jgi:hypothetical protein
MLLLAHPTTARIERGDFDPTTFDRNTSASLRRLLLGRPQMAECNQKQEIVDDLERAAEDKRKPNKRRR